MTTPEEMMMSQFTPGPWEIDPDNSDEFIKGPDGKRVASCFTESRPWREAEANARLIAAAPELLAACEAALPLVYMLGVKMNGPLEIAETHTALVAAIARAKGTA